MFNARKSFEDNLAAFKTACEAVDRDYGKTRAVELYERPVSGALDTAQKAAVKQTHATSIIANCIAHYEMSAGQPFAAHMLLGGLQRH